MMLHYNAAAWQKNAFMREFSHACSNAGSCPVRLSSMRPSSVNLAAFLEPCLRAKHGNWGHQAAPANSAVAGDWIDAIPYECCMPCISHMCRCCTGMPLDAMAIVKEHQPGVIWHHASCCHGRCSRRGGSPGG